MTQKSFLLLLSVMILAVLASSIAVAQMRGSSSGGMGKGQSPSGTMQGPMSQPSAGSMGPNGTQADRRQLMHTTARQDHQFGACQLAMQAVQGDIHGMLHRNNSASASGSSDSPEVSSDLSNDLQSLEQDDDDLASGLNDDQKAVLQLQIKELQQKTKEMEVLASQIKTEMANRDTDPTALRKDIKKLDKLSKDISKRQHDVAVALGITS
jgi:hypothetical protein